MSRTWTATNEHWLPTLTRGHRLVFCPSTSFLKAVPWRLAAAGGPARSRPTFQCALHDHISPTVSQRITTRDCKRLCYVGADCGEAASFHLLIQETRVLPPCGSFSLRNPAPSVSIRRSGETVEKFMREDVTGQAGRGTQESLSSCIGNKRRSGGHREAGRGSVALGLGRENSFQWGAKVLCHSG